jgi:hypothetical protein
MRVRSLYTTLIGGIVAAYGVLLQNSKGSLHFADVSVDPILPLAAAGSLVASLFYFVDRYWYHALLLGSVDQGAEIEKKWAALLPEMQLGSKISLRSPIDLSHSYAKYQLARLFVSDPRLKNDRRLHSDAKIEIFYKPVARLMLIIAGCAILFGGISVHKESLVRIAWHTVAGLRAASDVGEKSIPGVPRRADVAAKPSNAIARPKK